MCGVLFAMYREAACPRCSRAIVAIAPGPHKGTQARGPPKSVCSQSTCRLCVSAGELVQLQQAAGSASARHRRPAVMAALAGGGGGGGAAGRPHLEANMAAALALQSPVEYKRWLLTYVRHLAGAATIVSSWEISGSFRACPYNFGVLKGTLLV